MWSVCWTNECSLLSQLIHQHCLLSGAVLLRQLLLCWSLLFTSPNLVHASTNQSHMHEPKCEAINRPLTYLPVTPCAFCSQRSFCCRFALHDNSLAVTVWSAQLQGLRYTNILDQQKKCSGIFLIFQCKSLSLWNVEFHKRIVLASHSVWSEEKQQVLKCEELRL